MIYHFVIVVVIMEQFRFDLNENLVENYKMMYKEMDMGEKIDQDIF
jgi:hypothetical protein